MLKRLVVILSKAGLSAKSIENYIQVPKMVVASVLDEDGNQVYPRKWNHDFIDVPIVEESCAVFARICAVDGRCSSASSEMFLCRSDL